MKKKNMTVMLTFLGVCTSMLAAMPVCAAAGKQYSTVITGKTQVTIDKYLVMDQKALVPDAAFTFAVSAPEKDIAADAEAGTVKVFSGNKAGLPTFTAAEGEEASTSTVLAFTHTDAAVAEEDAADSSIFTTTGEDEKNDEKYVKKQLTLDFSNVVFTEPGIYRYYIQESGKNCGVSNDSEAFRTIDVYVVDSSDEKDLTLKIENSVVYSGKLTTAPQSGKKAADADKSDSYVNTYATRSLSFGKEVEGNQGSKDKYFKFTLRLSNADGAALTVVTDAFDAAPAQTSSTIYDAAAMQTANSRDDLTGDSFTGNQITMDENGAAECVFYLQDGQYVTLTGLPVQAEYELSEDAEDYTSAPGTAKTAAGQKTYNDAVQGTVLEQDIFTGFTNTREGVIPTGVLTTVASSAGILALGIAGVAGGALYLKKKRSEEE